MHACTGRMGAYTVDNEDIGTAYFVHYRGRPLLEYRLVHRKCPLYRVPFLVSFFRGSTAYIVPIERERETLGLTLSQTGHKS